MAGRAAVLFGMCHWISHDELIVSPLWWCLGWLCVLVRHCQDVMRMAEL